MSNKLALAAPSVLIYSRLGLGGGLVALGYGHGPRWGSWAVALLVLGVLTDVLDGVVAKLTFQKKNF